MTHTDWEQRFTDIGAIYKHDGNPLRPYALTSSGLISEGYFRGRTIQESPQLLSRAASALHELVRAHPHVPKDSMGTPLIDRVIGASTSGIALASHMASSIGIKTAYADRTSSGLVFSGFDMRQNEQLLVVDDTVTTGSTTHALVRAAYAAQPSIHIPPVVAVLCNRSCSDKLGSYDILSLLQWPVRRWEVGCNPFTHDGSELVPPVSPKTQWNEFTRPYE